MDQDSAEDRGYFGDETKLHCPVQAVCGTDERGHMALMLEGAGVAWPDRLEHDCDCLLKVL